MERDVFAGDSRGGRADDSMQVPTSATGHEEEAQAAATGHEEAQATVVAGVAFIPFGHCGIQPNPL